MSSIAMATNFTRVCFIQTIHHYQSLAAIRYALCQCKHVFILFSLMLALFFQSHMFIQVGCENGVRIEGFVLYQGQYILLDWLVYWLAICGAQDMQKPRGLIASSLSGNIGMGCTILEIHSLVNRGSLQASNFHGLYLDCPCKLCALVSDTNPHVH